MAGDLQLMKNLRVESFIVTVQLRRFGVFWLLSITQIFPFASIPSIGEAPDEDVQEGVAFELEIFRVECAGLLVVLTYGERLVLLHSVSRRGGWHWTEGS